MINTWEYRNYNNFWYQLLFILRHPIEFILTFKDNMYNWPDPANTIRKYWMKLYIRLPFQKPCRWLGNMLCLRIADCKTLDSFSCRTRGKNIKYYFANCKFGHIKFSQVSYIRNGKPSNVFFDITVATLLNEEEGKKHAEETKTIETVLYSGWVFTKKKAMRMFKEIIQKHRDIFVNYTYPTANDPIFAEIPVKMLKLLKTGKFDETEIYNVMLENIFNNTNDKIEKLWCYVTYLLTCINDFRAHDKLAHIHLICNNYMYAKKVKDNPMEDEVYSSYIKKGLTKQAKAYLKSMGLTKKSQEDDKKEIIKRINDLSKHYLDEELDYYRI